MPTVKTSAKGQVVIPKKERDKAGIRPGTKVLVKVVGDHVEIRPLPEYPVDAYCGVYQEGPPLTEALLRERMKDRRREEKNRP